MRAFFTSTRKVRLTGLIVLFCVLSGCSLGANASMMETKTPQATPGTPAQSLEVKQTATSVGPNDPWALMYKGVTVKIVSTDQRPSFADDPDPTPRPNWLFRINLQVTNPYTKPVDLFWDQAWQLHIVGQGNLVPIEVYQYMTPQSINTPPGTTHNWLDFPLSGKIRLQDAKLVVGELDELRITTALDRPGDLQAFRTKRITTNIPFEYGNSEWVIEQITSSTSAAWRDGTGGSQAKIDSRYITFQVKVTPKNNGIDPVLWKGFQGGLDGVHLSTERDSQPTQPGTGTLLGVTLNETTTQDGTLVFQAVVDEDGIPNLSTVPMWLIFPAHPSLNIGDVSVRFEI